MKRRRVKALPLSLVPLVPLFLLGCEGPRGPQSAPILSVDSPAAPYVLELWDLTGETSAFGRRPQDPDDEPETTAKGSMRLITEWDRVKLEDVNRTTLLLRQCKGRPFDLDPVPPPVAKWSRDQKAILLSARSAYGAGYGCDRGVKRFIYIPGLQTFWHVPRFEGRRSEALAAVGSPDSLISLPALESLGPLRPDQAETLSRYWESADSQTRRHLEEAIFKWPLCREGPGSFADRFLSRDDLSPEFRRKVLDQVLDRLATTREPCLKVPGMVEALISEAEGDPVFAARLVRSLQGADGPRSKLIRGRFGTAQNGTPGHPAEVQGSSPSS